MRAEPMVGRGRQLVWFIPWYDVPWVLSRKFQWAGEEVVSGGVTDLDRS